MTTKQRAYLKSLAMTMDPIFQVGKNSMTPEFTKAIAEALEARELIKISVLKNCADDPKELASLLAERTRSQVVQVIGKKIVLYKEGEDEKKKIILLNIVCITEKEEDMIMIIPLHILTILELISIMIKAMNLIEKESFL